MKGAAIKYSDEELTYIKSNCTLPRAELTKLFNEKFNRKLKVSNIDSLCKRKGWKTGRDGRFIKGSIPANKGKAQCDYMSEDAINRTKASRFKKGNTPHNHKPVGSERVNIEGYIEIKTEEPNIWELKHRVIWKAKHGEIEKGYNLVFKDHNKQNCTIENLLLVSDAENLFMNRSGLNNAKGAFKEIAKNIAYMNVEMYERLRQ